MRDNKNYTVNKSRINKRELYESIMFEVAKEVKRAIEENYEDYDEVDEGWRQNVAGALAGISMLAGINVNAQNINQDNVSAKPKIEMTQKKMSEEERGQEIVKAILDRAQDIDDVSFQTEGMQLVRLDNGYYKVQYKNDRSGKSIIRQQKMLGNIFSISAKVIGKGVTRIFIKFRSTDNKKESIIAFDSVDVKGESRITNFTIDSVQYYAQTVNTLDGSQLQSLLDNGIIRVN